MVTLKYFISKHLKTVTSRSTENHQEFEPSRTNWSPRVRELCKMMFLSEPVWSQTIWVCDLSIFCFSKHQKLEEIPVEASTLIILHLAPLAPQLQLLPGRQGFFSKLTVVTSFPDFQRFIFLPLDVLPFIVHNLLCFYWFSSSFRCSPLFVCLFLFFPLHFFVCFPCYRTGEQCKRIQAVYLQDSITNLLIGPSHMRITDRQKWLSESKLKPQTCGKHGTSHTNRSNGTMKPSPHLRSPSSQPTPCLP